MPSPLEARAENEKRRRIAQEKPAARPSEQRCKAQREAEHAVFCRAWKAERRDKETEPLFEALGDAS
jgi:hypothetical protein